MKVTVTMRAVALSGCLVAASMALAQEYSWTDKNGTVHFTDDPEQIPKHLRQKVLERHGPRDSNKKTTTRRSKIHAEIPGSNERLPLNQDGYQADEKGGEKLGSGNRQSDTLTQASGKKAWQDEISRANQEVAELEQKCNQLTNQRDLSSNRSLLFAHPTDRKKAAEASDALTKCEKDLRQARHYLKVELPERARRIGVPPGWLR